MDFNETVIYKLAHIFGTTEIVLFLSPEEMKLIQDELEESRGGKKLITEMGDSKSEISNNLDFQMYQFNGTTIHIGNKQKLMSLIRESKPSPYKVPI